MMRYTGTSKKGAMFVASNEVREDLVDLLFDIDDKKLVGKFRKILKDWTKADIASRKEYSDRIEEEDEDTV